MPFQRISKTPAQLLAAFQKAVQPLLYPSETDAPIEVHLLPAAEVGDALLSDDLKLFFYTRPGHRAPVDMSWAEANRPDSVGTQKFFRDKLEMITTAANDEVYFQEVYHRHQVPKWRRLHNLVFDNLIQCRWFRAELGGSNSARKDIYLVGRHVKIEVDSDTNEMKTSLLDWVVLSTYVIET